MLWTTARYDMHNKRKISSLEFCASVGQQSGDFHTTGLVHYFHRPESTITEINSEFYIIHFYEDLDSEYLYPGVYNDYHQQQ